MKTEARIISFIAFVGMLAYLISGVGDPKEATGNYGWDLPLTGLAMFGFFWVLGFFSGDDL